jgi:hypothetical protein
MAAGWLTYGAYGMGERGQEGNKTIEIDTPIGKIK